MYLNSAWPGMRQWGSPTAPHPQFPHILKLANRPIPCTADPCPDEALPGGLDQSPIIIFRRLDNILSRVEEFRKEGHPDFMTYTF